MTLHDETTAAPLSDRRPDEYSRTLKEHMNETRTAYETDFARYLGAGVHAFAFWKGRVALFAILKALGIDSGDEVILPGFTCVVVANSIRFAGATPVYVDIAPGSYNLDVASVEKAITSKTKAIVVQHTFGLPAPVSDLLKLVAKHKLQVIEDCAHSLGSTVEGRSLGTFGHAAFFSSQWSKPYTTGLGGIAVTQDPDLAAKLSQVQNEFREPSMAAKLRIRLQYQAYQRFFSPRVYWVAQDILRGVGRLGLFVASSSESELNGLMPEDHHWYMAHAQQQAGLRQLVQVPPNLLHSRSLATIYDKGLQKEKWTAQPRSEQTVMLRYPVRVRNKTELLQLARKARIELGSWFEAPLHGIPLSEHQTAGYTLGECPNAEVAAAEVVNLPLHSRVNPAEAKRILRFFLTYAK